MKFIIITLFVCFAVAYAQSAGEALALFPTFQGRWTGYIAQVISGGISFCASIGGLGGVFSSLLYLVAGSIGGLTQLVALLTATNPYNV